MSNAMENNKNYILISDSEDEGERRDFDLNEEPPSPIIDLNEVPPSSPIDLIGVPYNSQVLFSLHI